MKISLVTPTFNSAENIQGNLESVLAQTIRPYEHIFIDNLSHDKTQELVAKTYGDRVNHKFFSEKDDGISDAFNKGVEQATGDVILILNSDDRFYQTGVLERVQSVFENHNPDIVHGDMIFADNELGFNRRRPLLCSLEEAFPYNHPTCFVKKEIYQKFGLFSKEYRYTMDFEFFCRLYKTPKEPKINFFYFEEFPITVMMAGGASDENEIKTLGELEKSLKSYGFYTNRAKKSLRRRWLRIKLKKVLLACGLKFPLRLWRYLKWR